MLLNNDTKNKVGEHKGLTLYNKVATSRSENPGKKGSGNSNELLKLNWSLPIPSGRILAIYTK